MCTSPASVTTARLGLADCQLLRSVANASCSLHGRPRAAGTIDIRKKQAQENYMQGGEKRQDRQIRRGDEEGTGNRAKEGENVTTVFNALCDFTGGGVYPIGEMYSISCMVGSRMTVDPRIPTTPGRSVSGFHRPGRHCLQPSAKRREVSGESHEG